ncbi:MAG: UxaA family hydrolase [Verrucomicrobiota bacterium]
MNTHFTFDQAARIPMPGDNVAIASRRLEAGTRLDRSDVTFCLPHTILEGHRFAVDLIRTGEALLSWGLPFGTALREIAPGDYVCNEKILLALRQRHVEFALPDRANFKDHFSRYQLDEHHFRPGQQVPRHAESRFFDGFAREGGRGVGTRNYIVILGTTSLTGSFARSLADRFKEVSSRCRNIDGVVAIAHTEGGSGTRPNNLDFLLRTLAGFVVHPNVGAILAVDFGSDAVNNLMLREYLARHDYPVDKVLHDFMTWQGNYQAALDAGEAVVKAWLQPVNACQRTAQSVEHLRIALQCGGSDAFSGVSGNPLAGWVAKELVRYGGSANLAETDELIGAEPYVLGNVRDLPTARAFLEKIERFQQRAAWHGHDAEGNPSGGNNYRGLYNIAIKSIGAARKKDPEVRLDYVIDYSQRMTAPGFYFMDSPGNDLEGIAGQVAAGCNMILFTTGNGSITNFPFVPTIKIVTTTGRYQLIPNEMDVNAGRYQDGLPMEDLGRETFAYTLRIASGQRSVGEKAGHSQVQLWREWRQTDGSRLVQLQNAPRPNGQPLPVKTGPVRPAKFRACQTARGVATDQIGLIVPTSLCSGAVGKMIADKLNSASAKMDGVSRFVSLAHTEGCGVSGGECEEILLRTLAGHLCHPLVKRALLLEHGCEKTHNDAFRNYLQELSVDGSRFGWASIQMDGGLDNVTAKVCDWFRQALASEKELLVREAGLDQLRLGLVAVGPLPEPVAAAFAHLAQRMVNAGGNVVVPENSSLLLSGVFVRELLQSTAVYPTLSYGEALVKSGFHIMETPTDHPVETLTGLAATGVEVMLAHTATRPLQSHPMIPLIEVTGNEATWRSFPQDLDLLLNLENRAPEALAEELLELILRVASREYTPKLFTQGNTDFQMTRGWQGVSL